MKVKASWLYLITGSIIMMLLIATVIFIVINRNWNISPLKNSINNLDNSQVYSSFDTSENSIIEAEFDFPLLTEAGFIFPKLSENIQNSYQVDYESETAEKNGEESQVESIPFFDHLLGSESNQEYWSELIKDNSVEITEDKNEINYELSEKAAEELIKKEVTSFIQQRFQGYIEPSEIVITEIDSPKASLTINKQSYQIETLTFSVQNVLAKVIFEGENIDFIKESLELKSKSEGEISFKNYSYSIEVTDMDLNPNYNPTNSFFERVRLALSF